MSNPSCAIDPSVGEDADTSPAKLGRKMTSAPRSGALPAHDSPMNGPPNRAMACKMQ